MALSRDGSKLYSFGKDDKGQLGIGQRDRQCPKRCETVPQLVRFPGQETVILTDIACGDNHAVAISHGNNVYTWGFGEVDATGHQTADEVDIWAPTILNLQPHVQQDLSTLCIAGGGSRTLLVVANRDA
jgi:alpha-tubulin suppressor-like RCC1 family protein